ncbi:ATPase associated with chromosome architecture/replication [Bacillus thuringiensis serovar israelensis ATCC 35646]|nr:ATPase associated with chromosome architecture/replication [Bacillus thuringiensis serovar israelensis ATCC 35646]
MKNSGIITIERKMKIFIFIFPIKQHTISNSVEKNDTIERDYMLRETV